MKKLLFVLAIVAVFFLSSCKSELQKDPYVEFDEKAFSAAKEKWASLNSNNYTFTYNIKSDATGPNKKKYHVTVVNGESSFTITDDRDDESQSDREEINRYPTVDSLFKLIQDCYDSDSAFVAEKPKGVRCYVLSVDYDEATGIPTKMEDYIQDDGTWDGGWFHMYITDIAVN